MDFTCVQLRALETPQNIAQFRTIARNLKTVARNSAHLHAIARNGIAIGNQKPKIAIPILRILVLYLYSKITKLILMILLLYLHPKLLKLKLTIFFLNLQQLLAEDPKRLWK